MDTRKSLLVFINHNFLHFEMLNIYKYFINYRTKNIHHYNLIALLNKYNTGC